MKLVNARRKVASLKEYLREGVRVLDFGCGDMQFAEELHKNLPTLKITGVDVVDFGVRPKGVRFRLYDGVTLPFAASSFDTVISYHVFHHTTQPFALLRECIRVAKSAVLFVEPVYRGFWDIPGMQVMDWLFNVWKDRTISMPFSFGSEKKWRAEIIRAEVLCQQVIDVELLPPWFPTGRSLLFVCRK